MCRHLDVYLYLALYLAAKDNSDLYSCIRQFISCTKKSLDLDLHLDLSQNFLPHMTCF